MFQEVMSELSMTCSFNTISYSESVSVSGYTHLISVPNTEVYKLEYVKRDGLDCREISNQSIVTAQSNLGRGFHINDTTLDKIHFSATSKVDGMELNFATTLEVGTVIESILIVNSPDGTDSFTDTAKLPYIAYNAIYYGIYTKVLDKLITLGDDRLRGIYGNVAINYQNEKMKLKAYIYNLKTETSFPQIQPLKWLSED